MDRAFERVAAAQLSALEASERAQGRPLSAEEQLRRESAPMTSKDAVQRILLSWKDKDYFRLLQLPAPEADELGRAVWNVTPSEVAKSYRSLSVLVHPDKNPGEDARQAFEVLNQAYRLLRDPGKLEEVLKDAAAKARAQRESREAKACMSERLALNAQKNVRAKELRKEEGQSFQAEIVQQMKRRQEEAKRKRAAKPSYRREHSDDEQERASTATAGAAGAAGTAGQAAQRGHAKLTPKMQEGGLRSERQPDEQRNGRGKGRQKLQGGGDGGSSSDGDDGGLTRQIGGKKRKKPTFI